jgi:hypothetical protein
MTAALRWISRVLHWRVPNPHSCDERCQEVEDIPTVHPDPDVQDWKDIVQSMSDEVSVYRRERRQEQRG